MPSTSPPIPPPPVSGFADALAPDRLRLGLTLGLSALTALLELAPYGLVWAIGALLLGTAPFAATGAGATPGTDPALLLALAGLTLLCVMARTVCQGATLLLAHHIAFAAETRLRHRLIDHIARLPLLRLDGKAAALKRTVMEDVGRLNGVLGHTIPDVVTGLLVPVAATAVLLAVDWRLTLAVLALLPLAVLAQWRMAVGSADQYARWIAAEAEAGTALAAYVRGLVTLRAFNRQAETLSQVHGAITAVSQLAAAITRRAAAPYAVFGMSMTYPPMMVLAAGLPLYASGALPADHLLLFVAVGGTTLLPLGRAVLALHGLRALQASAGRINALLALPEMPDPASPAPMPQDTTLTFDTVSFHATPEAGQDGGRCLLDRVSFTAAPGTTTVIVGPSGAGKTTLARLAARLDDPSDGQIRLGGTDLRILSLQDLRSRIAVVFQDPVLFDGSLRDGLRMTRPDASDADLTAALHAAGAGPLLDTLPGGLDARVGDHGARLSGGERQRIALARAFLKDAPVLILDEATAHVDPMAEREIRAALKTLMRGRTVLVIAHRLRGLETADQIVVLESGRLTACGPHSQLLITSPTYSRLWAGQARTDDWSLRARTETDQCDT